ncbi:putative ParB-like nuclease [compost metagenome]
MENVLNLKPTQPVVGMKSIKVKTKLFEEISRDERHEYLQENPVPVIKGPNQDLYMIDHHHMSRALFDSDHRKIYVQIVRDWSDLSATDFWERMDKEGFAYLQDSEGNRITPAELPTNITDLKNDPFRSLAYFARKQGAYEKSIIPFAEFKWAEFYRTYFSERDLEKDWSKTLAKALELSFTQEAAQLPGYKGEFSCERIF